MYAVKNQPHSTWPPLHAVASLLLAGALLAVGMGFAPAITVTVNGARVTAPVGSRIAELQSSGIVKSRPGALLAVDKSVLRPAGGGEALVTRNGTAVLSDQRLFDGDVITSVNGIDRIEPVVVTKEPIQFETRIEGNGPVMRLVQPGSVGVREITKGRVSGITVGERVDLPASNMVVRRTNPRPSEKLVALTFDDGPWPGQTDKILDILKHEGVHATFFMVGGRVKNAPALARRVAEEGHLIGNHTLSHKLLTAQTPAEVTRQIAGAEQRIRSATGVKPVWFRPPYGAIDANVWKQTRAQRLKVALWDIDTRDWSHPGTKAVVATAERGVRAGSIILMHDGGIDRRQTIAALPRVIRDLKARGFVFVTLEELDTAN